MEIDILQLFMRIASGNTLSSVAEDANLSQSSLSKSIIRLENELGVQLLDRTHRNVTLTPAGTALYRHLQTIMPQLYDMSLSMKEFSTCQRIRIAALPISHMYEINEHLAAFMRQYPDIDIEIVGHSDYELTLHRLNQGVIDLVIGHQPLIDSHEYRCFKLHDDALLVAVNADHPLASFKRVTFDDITKYKCVIRRSIQKILRFLPCSAGNFALMEISDNRDFDRLRRLSGIRFGNFSSIFYKNDLLMLRLEGIVLRPIVGCEDIPLVAACAKGREPTTAVKMVIRYLQQALSSPDYDLHLDCE